MGLAEVLIYNLPLLGGGVCRNSPIISDANLWVSVGQNDYYSPLSANSVQLMDSQACIEVINTYLYNKLFLCDLGQGFQSNNKALRRTYPWEHFRISEEYCFLRWVFFRE